MRNRSERPDGGAAGAGDSESERGIVTRETEEALTSALRDSDTAAELLHDSAEDSRRPSIRQLMLGAVGLTLTVVAARRLAPRVRTKPSRLPWRR